MNDKGTVSAADRLRQLRSKYGAGGSVSSENQSKLAALRSKYGGGDAAPEVKKTETPAAQITPMSQGMGVASFGKQLMGQTPSAVIGGSVNRNFMSTGERKVTEQPFEKRKAAAEQRMKELDEIEADLKDFEIAVQNIPAHQRPVKNIGGFTSSEAAREEYNRVMAEYAAMLKENGQTDSNFGRNVRYVLERVGAGTMAALEGLADAGAAALADERVGKALRNAAPALGMAQQMNKLFDQLGVLPEGAGFDELADKMLSASPSQERMQDIESRYAPGKVGQTAGEVSQAVGGMIPAIAANIVLPGSGLAVTGVQAGGQSAQQAYQEGATMEQATNFGIAAGALEGLIEALSGGVAGLGEGFLDTIAGKSIGKMVSKLGASKTGKVLAALANNVFVKGLADSLGEGIEEGVSAILTPYLARLTYNKSAETATVNEVLHDVFVGALTGGVFQGVGAIGSAFANRGNATASAIEGQKKTAPEVETAQAEITQPTETVESGTQMAQESAEGMRERMDVPAKESAQGAEIRAGIKSPVAKSTRAEYTETNMEGVANEEVHLRNGGQRDGSAYPGGQVPAVEGSAGQTESRNGAGRPADSGTASFTYGAKVSTRALLGDNTASANRNLRVVTGGDSAHTAEARRLGSERGLKVVLFSGGNLTLTDKNGNAYEARAYIEDGRVYVRADHPDFTADQLMRHEVGHDMIAKGEVDVDAVRERIGNERAERLAQMYAEAYSGSDLTEAEIWEECICDSLADMNIFASRAESAEAAEYLGESKRAAQEGTGTVNTERGPPATVGGKASREKVFPPYNVSQSDANERAIRWAYRSDVKHGDKKMFSYRGNWYLVEADKDADLRYRIIEELAEGQYEYFVKELKNDGGAQRGVQATAGQLGERNRPREWAGGGEQGSAPAPARQRGKSGEVRQMGEQQNRGRTSPGNGNGNLQGGGASRKSGGVSRKNEVSEATKKYLEKHEKAKRISKIEKTLRNGNLNDAQKSLLRSELKELRKEFEPIKGKTSREVSFEQRVANNQTAIDHFGKTYNWSETGYILLDGTRLDFSGKHDGAPGGYRTVDHRDIRDALGYEYGGEGYSDGMVQFMAEGNIRVMPETDGINLSVAPTKEQERLIDMFVSRKRGEIVLDLDDTDGRTIASVEYPRGTRSARVINDIRKFFEDGTVPRISELSQFYLSRETTPAAELTEEQKATLSATQEAVRAAIREELDRMGKEYGWIKKGENPARDVRIPKRTEKDKKVSQTVRTILEAGATPDEALPTIEKMVADGDFSYEVYGDKKAIKDAEEFVKHRGWGDATREWFDRMKKGEVSKKNTAIGWTLYNNAVNSNDMETAVDILNAMVEHQRSAAQAVQATRILKKLTPEGQLYGVQKSVARLQEELNEKYKDYGVELKIDPEMAEELLNAPDQKGRDEALKKIYKDIGRQMPSKFVDKFNAWRYLAMLGNVRTHVRNIVGNAGFAPVVAVKNLTATAIESAVNWVSGGKTGRTKAIVTFGKEDRGRLKAAWADYSVAAEATMDGGKYSDLANTNKYIEEGRRIFGRTDQAKTAVGRAVSGTVGKGVEAARKFNSKALEVEDQWFSQPHYAAALASYCKANGITAEQMSNGGITDAARAYAIKEAQKATYRDTNALSDTLSSLGRNRGNRNIVNIAMEGILPFRKTPANILARGLEYSPLGIAKSIYDGIKKVRHGDMTATELIDEISASLTGSGLVALGAYLASQCLVRGHGGDDEDREKFEDMMGHQNYALEIGDKSYTLDWLSPMALPFFVGVNIWELAKNPGKDGEVTVADVLSAIGNVSEPMMEMSCLQSLNGVFDAVGYAQSEGLSGLPTALIDAATSLVTQLIPTLFGQAERVSQDVRMTTYTDKNNKYLTTDMQYAIGGASAKIPGFDYNQIAYIDAWGRTESTGNLMERVFGNMINPWYASDISESDMEKELMRLYEATGEDSVFPDRAQKYFTVNKERLDLNGAQYVSYAKNKGQTAYTMMTEMTKSSAYTRMTDAQKVQAVKWVYEYANAVAKESVSKYKLDGWVAKAENARKSKGVDVMDYILYKSALDALNDNDSVSQKEAEKALNKVSGLSRDQKAYLWSNTNKDWATSKNNPFK